MFTLCRATALHVLGTAVLVLGASVPKPCCGPGQWEAVIFQQKGAYNEMKDRKLMWMIEGTTCTKHSLTATMTSPCIDVDATLLGSHLYGGVTSNTWAWRHGNLTSRVTVSDDGCYPLVTTEITTGDVWSLTLGNVQNMTEGIQHPSVFDLPPNCPH